MDKKNNMKQAMYEMFGVGAAPAEEVVPPVKEEQKPRPEPLPILKEEDKAPVQTAKTEPEKEPVVQHAPKPRVPASYLAPGTVMEGTLRAVGDVEIAGDFKGDITTEGTVILHSNIRGNLSVSSLDLSGCTLIGDVAAGGRVTVSEDSEIRGNVTARELQCAGQIVGDLNVSEHTALDGTAQINGNISTGTMSVERGAFIKGSIETKVAAAPK